MTPEEEFWQLELESVDYSWKEAVRFEKTTNCVKIPPLMPDGAIITIDNLGKRYSLRHLRDQRYVALRDVIVEKATGLFRRSPKGRSKIEGRRSGNGSDLPSPSSQLPSTEEFWALRHINFEVRQGEVVGIIGRNGAGKSTLLKILSRITDPTEGRVTLRGRVASLLEVGTGFHPELTGRENIYLNGAILGMSRAEIRQKFDEIVAFAETEKFLDTPVKRYSSGMYVRLAFAVAAHLEPEILIIDEVLAVGDAEFQKKCLGKMESVARKEGRTVLFVSHNMAAVQALCDTGVLLVRGTLVERGTSAKTIARYTESMTSQAAGTIRELSGSLHLVSFECTPSMVERGKDVVVSIELEASKSETISDLALLIHSANGERASLIDLRTARGAHKLLQNQRLKTQVRVSQIPFVEGDFNVGLYVNADSVCQSFMNLIDLTVLPDSLEKDIVPREAQFRGIVELTAQVEHELMTN